MDEQQTTSTGALAVSERSSDSLVNDVPFAQVDMIVHEAAQWLRSAHSGSRVIDAASYHRALDDAANALAVHGAPRSSPLGELSAWLREDQQARRALVARCHASLRG